MPEDTISHRIVKAKTRAILRDVERGEPVNMHPWEELAALRKSQAALLEALGIITRACEAGAYVGKHSPAVMQARAAIIAANGESHA